MPPYKTHAPPPRVGTPLGYAGLEGMVTTVSWRQGGALGSTLGSWRVLLPTYRAITTVQLQDGHSTAF
jgi:hypothetical protein